MIKNGPGNQINNLRGYYLMEKTITFFIEFFNKIIEIFLKKNIGF